MYRFLKDAQVTPEGYKNTKINLSPRLSPVKEHKGAPQPFGSAENVGEVSKNQ
jgi:hypothetical protein